MKKLFWVNILLVGLTLSCVSRFDEVDIAGEYYNVGNAYLELGNFDKAIYYYLKSVEVDPGFSRSKFNLIEAYMSKGKYEHAKKILDTLSHKDLQSLKLKKSRAYLLYLQGDLEGSIRLYNELLAHGDVSFNVEMNMVKTYFQLGDFKSAAESLNSINDNLGLLYDIEDDVLKDVYFISGLVFNELNDSEGALRYFSLSYELGNRAEDVLAEILKLYELKEDYAGQQKILSDLVELGEDNLGNYIFKQSVVSFIGFFDFKKGYLLLEKAIDSGFNDSALAQGLLDKPNLIEVDKIRQLFVDSEILK